MSHLIVSFCVDNVDILTFSMFRRAGYDMQLKYTVRMLLWEFKWYMTHDVNTAGLWTEALQNILTFYLKSVSYIKFISPAPSRGLTKQAVLNTGSSNKQRRFKVSFIWESHCTEPMNVEMQV